MYHGEMFVIAGRGFGRGLENGAEEPETLLSDLRLGGSSDVGLFLWVIFRKMSQMSRDYSLPPLC